MAQFKRYFDLQLFEGHSHFLWGARKTGKSTFLKGHFPGSYYIDLLSYDQFQSFDKDPTALRDAIRALPQDKRNLPIIIDEVQKVPALLDEIHWIIENMKPVQFILCGSSVKKLKQTGANLLGGRAIRNHFLPLCYPELGRLDWPKIINRGLLPSHYESALAKELLSSYIHDYILPEVHVEANLRSTQGFHRFLEALIFSQGELLNYNNISRDCGVDAKTVRAYFEILVDMYLGYFVYPYRSAQKRESVKEAPKFYLMDVGLSSFLKRYDFQTFQGSEAGRAFEHYVFLELKAYHVYKRLRDDIQFWRTRNGSHEVDFILKRGQVAIECKISQIPEKADFKGLLAFFDEGPSQLHMVCHSSLKRSVDYGGKKITVWPIQDFLEALWAGEIVS